MPLVAVYGSLRKGMGNHEHFFEDKNYVGEHTTNSLYTMISLGGFPGVTKGGNTAIKCEIYNVPTCTLDLLDSLEGHPDMYRREIQKTVHGDAWLYIYQGVHKGRLPIVTSGDWVSYRQRKD